MTVSTRRPSFSSRFRTAASAGNMLRTGAGRVACSRRPPAPGVVIVSPLVKDAAFVREFDASARAVSRICRRTGRPGLEGRLLALVQAGYIDSGVTESVRIRRAEAAAKKTIRWIRAKRLLASTRGAVDGAAARRATT